MFGYQSFPRFNERMTPHESADGLNRLADAIRGQAAARQPAAPLGIAPNGGLYLDDTAYKRIPARLTAVNSVSIGDNQPAQLRYAFIQQIFDPTTGLYSDFTSGLIGDGALCYATELNNGSMGQLTATIPATAGTGPLVWLRSKGIVSGQKVYEFAIGASDLAWIKATTSTPSTIYLGRTITDGIISGDILQSATAAFTSDDVGATLIGVGISGGATISSILDSTTVLMSAAGSSGSNVTVQIVTGSIKAYQAALDVQSTTTGTWSSGATVWLQQGNDSAWLPLVGGAEPILVPVVSGQIYQCRYFTADAGNVPIWTVAEQEEGGGITVEDDQSPANVVTPVTTLKFKDLFIASSPTAGEADVTPNLVNNWADARGNSNAVLSTTWTTIGSTTSVQFTLPGAGTYLLWAVVSGALRTTTSNTYVLDRFYDQTNSVAVGDPAVICGIILAGTPESDDGGSATLLWVYTVTGSTIIDVQGWVNNNNSGTVAIALCPDQAGGRGSNCFGGYIRIG